MPQLPPAPSYLDLNDLINEYETSGPSGINLTTGDIIALAKVEMEEQEVKSDWLINSIYELEDEGDIAQLIKDVEAEGWK